MKYYGSLIFGSAFIREIRFTSRKADFNIFDLDHLTRSHISDLIWNKCLEI